MNIKVHFLFNHLDRFPNSLCNVNDQQGEQFDQDINVMEEQYQGRRDVDMMTNYCWSIKRDCL